MSLVSCVISKQLWYGRASDLEFEISKIAEKLNNITKMASRFADLVTRKDNQINRHQDMLQNIRNSAFSLFDSRSMYGNNPQFQQMYNQRAPMLYGRASQIAHTLRSLQFEKHQYDMMQKMMHEQEKTLQARKLQLDTQKKLADQMGPAFEKMEDQAIKRFAPKV